MITKKKLNKKISIISEFANINTDDKSQYYYIGYLKGLQNTQHKSKKFVATIEEFASIKSDNKSEAYYIGFANAIRYKNGQKEINVLERLIK